MLPTLDLTASLAAPAAFGAQAVGGARQPFARSRWQPWLAGCRTRQLFPRVQIIKF
jgi:hypothetical protein